MPSVTLESTQSPSDGSSHSSSIYSPRSASGSVKSPVEAALDLTKTDIDDINNLLFSFGAPYDNPSTAHISKEPIVWPHTSAPPQQSADSNSTPTTASHPTTSSPHDYNYATHAFNGSNGESQRNPTNGALYPSLAGLGGPKPIKPLPNHAQKNGHAGEQHQQPKRSQQQQPPSYTLNSNNGMYAGQMPPPHLQHSMPTHGSAPQMPPVSFDYLAPQRSVATPYIASEHVRDPAMQSIQLLSRAPPPSSSTRSHRNLLEQAEDKERAGRSTKQGVSSLRSTAMEDDESDERDHSPRQTRVESPESMSEDEQHQAHGEQVQPAAYPRISSYEDNTLPPIDARAAAARGSECHLPSLRSLLSNDTPDPYEASPAVSTSSVSFTDSPRSPPQQTFQAASHKRSTPSRQFYPSLSSLSSSHTAGSSSASSSSAHYHHHHHHHHHPRERERRPSTGERMDRITYGVGNFRMSSIDDYSPDHERLRAPSAISGDYEDSECKSESDDDTSVDAVYKRSRLRTQSPPSMQHASLAASEADSDDEDGHHGNRTAMRYSLSHLIEKEERQQQQYEDNDDEEDDDSSSVLARNHQYEMLRRRRLAVIQALVARANALFRDNLKKSARVQHLPALVRVKEEEMDW